jgi:hypothetical protein
MKNLEEALREVLTEPQLEDLVDLQGALLALDRREPAVSRALEITGRFYHYLGELQGKISAREYSELASRLDIGAVGAVALENLLAGERAEFWRQFLLGAVSEGLMVAASRQYIKAWQVETTLVHADVAWFLAEVLWTTSIEMQPDLAAEQRWQAIRALLAPANDPEVPGADKALLLGRIFQLLLIAHLAPLLQPGDSDLL